MKIPIRDMPENDRFFERLEAFADSSRSLAAVYVFKRASVAHGNKSGPVEGLVREARPDGSKQADDGHVGCFRQGIT